MKNQLEKNMAHVPRNGYEQFIVYSYSDDWVVITHGSPSRDCRRFLGIYKEIVAGLHHNCVPVLEEFPLKSG